MQVELAEICSRYNRLYTGANADMLDRKGLRNQVLPNYITPLTNANRVAGAAFTGRGYPCAESANNDTDARLGMLDSITPGTVSVWSCGGSSECAHWGEIMSSAARDVDFINAIQHPVFARFKSPAS